MPDTRKKMTLIEGVGHYHYKRTVNGFGIRNQYVTIINDRMRYEVIAV